MWGGLRHAVFCAVVLHIFCHVAAAFLCLQAAPVSSKPSLSITQLSITQHAAVVYVARIRAQELHGCVLSHPMSSPVSGVWLVIITPEWVVIVVVVITSVWGLAGWHLDLARPLSLHVCVAPCSLSGAVCLHAKAVVAEKNQTAHV